MNTDDRFLRTQDPEAQWRICQSFLGKLAKTPDKKRRLAIFKACAKVQAPWVEGLFWEGLGDTCEEVRGYLIRALAAKPRLNLSLALSRLHRPPWFAKSAVLRVLGTHQVEEALAEISRVLEDSNADVRCSAAWALGEIGGAEAVKLLVTLKKDANAYVRLAAEEAIEKASQVRFS